RNPTAVVHHGDGVIGVDHDVDPGTVTGERLVHGVVHHLVDQVVQTSHAGGADVHPRALPHGLESLEDLDLAGGILVLLRLPIRHDFFVLVSGKFRRFLLPRNRARVACTPAYS